MSYSRWGSSRWYTYWRASNQKQDHNTPVFAVDSFGEGYCEFQAARIRKDVDACVAEAVAKQGGTPEEAAELRGYMLNFLADVDREYPRRTP